MYWARKGLLGAGFLWASPHYLFPLPTVLVWIWGSLLCVTTCCPASGAFLRVSEAFRRGSLFDGNRSLGQAFEGHTQSTLLAGLHSKFQTSYDHIVRLSLSREKKRKKEGKGKGKREGERGREKDKREGQKQIFSVMQSMLGIPAFGRILIACLRAAWAPIMSSMETGYPPPKKNSTNKKQAIEAWGKNCKDE